MKSIVNQYRRKITQTLTNSIGKKSLNKIIKEKNKALVLKRVLVNRPNQRLGNTLLITPLIQEIITNYPEVKIDLFVKGKTAPFVFQNYPQVDQIIELPKKPFKQLFLYFKTWFKIRKYKYDLVINTTASSSSGKLATLFTSSKYKLYGNEFECNEHIEEQIHYGKAPVYLFRNFLELFDINSQDIYPNLNVKLSESEKSNGKTLLNNLGIDPSKKTIAFFTYATGDKCYSYNWWANFYAVFYPKYKEKYNLIEILPIENISMLANKLPSFYSKDVREIASLMHQCEIVLAADSGMMHLASASQATTIGLFKYDNFLKYKPYGGYNTYKKINCTSDCESLVITMDTILDKNKKELV